MGGSRSGARVGVGMLRGAGAPISCPFLDLEIHQDSTIVQFVFYQKGVGGTDRF